MNIVNNILGKSRTYDKKQLAKGMKEEMEHTKFPYIARQIILFK